MKDYDIENLVEFIRENSVPVVLFGASDYGELAAYALRQLGVDIQCFCDNSENKQGTRYCGLDVVSPAALRELDPEVQVFISSNSFASIIPQLEDIGISNYYDCVSLFDQADFSQGGLGISLPQIRRRISLHAATLARLAAPMDQVLNLSAMDVVVTEACSLKCIDCSNLMQYYTAPKNSDMDLLLSSIDKLMACVDRLGEVRVLGGEPFMNKQIHQVIDKLVGFDQIDNVVIYTNGTIAPKGENLTCLQNDKVLLSVTDYGELSRNHDKMIDLFDAHGIAYKSEIATEWTDSGRIKYRERPPQELSDMFSKCCVRDLMTLLNGKLYRCPFSANATNLKAVPYDPSDVIDLSDEVNGLAGLKEKIVGLYRDKQYLTACHYCNGRDFRTAKVEAGVQTRTPLALEKVYA